MFTAPETAAAATENVAAPANILCRRRAACLHVPLLLGMLAARACVRLIAVLAAGEPMAAQLVSAARQSVESGAPEGP